MNIRKLMALINNPIFDRALFKYIAPVYYSTTKQNEKKRKQLRLQMNITDHCNLNCKGCAAFSPIAEKKYLDIDILERDFTRLSELTDNKIDLIDLLGGEPLLHSEINKIMSISRKYFYDGNINIITNGILLNKMPNNFWHSCRVNNINIIISSYPIKLNTEELKELGKKNNTKLIFREGTNIWHKAPYDLNGNQNAEKNFIVCSQANQCIHLEDGKLATCPIVFNIKHFNRYFGEKIKIKENDYINIFKVNNIDEILEFLCKPNSICAYCNLKKDYNVNWDVTKKEITEWI